MNYKSMWNDYKKHIESKEHWNKCTSLEAMAVMESVEYFQEERLTYRFDYEKFWMELKRKILSKKELGKNDLKLFIEEIEDDI